MHLGRNHHTGAEVAVSIVGGFTASFLALFLNATVRVGPMRGQLIAGDPTVNREFPTTLNTMHAAMDGQDSVIGALGSYGFWVAVLIGGIIASFALFKLVRNYV